MNTISKTNIDEELDVLRKIKHLYRDNDSLNRQLVQRGYELKTLGSGNSSRVLEGDVVVQKLHTRKYLNGTYLIVGAMPDVERTNHIRVYYKGWVKEVID